MRVPLPKSLPRKVGLLTALAILIPLSAAALMILSEQRIALNGQAEDTKRLLDRAHMEAHAAHEDALRRKGRTASHTLSSVASKALVAYDLMSLEQTAAALCSDPEIATIQIFDNAGKELISSANRRDDAIIVHDDILLRRRKIGSVAVHLDGTLMRTRLAQSQATHDSTVRRQVQLAAITKRRMNWILLFTLALCALSVVVVLRQLLARVVLKRLDQLTAASEAVASDDFSVRASELGDDEVARLGRVFNGMIQRIAQGRAWLEDQIQQRTIDLQASRDEFRSLLETTDAIPWRYNVVENRFEYVGPQAGALLGCTNAEWLAPGFWDSRVHPDDRQQLEDSRIVRSKEAERHESEFRLQRDDGEFIWVQSIDSALHSDDEPSVIQGFILDVTDQRRIERDLRQAQKLESIGQLAAGIAHEINTPTQFVGDNTRFLDESFQDLAPILAKADALAKAVCEGTGSPELADELKSALADADIEFLSEEIPHAIKQSLDGLDRVRKIVQSMKEFSHPGGEGITALDLNHAIETTITVATSEWRLVADMETDFDPDLPLVPCLPGELNQVVLNIIVNAAHAISDRAADSEHAMGTITVRTCRDEDFAEIRISDTGSGIPEEARAKVFDPFFTTKEVGKGTGQGLSIAHNVVVQKHGGTIDFETATGEGTTFIIRLPLSTPAAACEPR